MFQAQWKMRDWRQRVRERERKIERDRESERQRERMWNITNIEKTFFWQTCALHCTVLHSSLHCAPLITKLCITHHCTVHDSSLHCEPLITALCITYHYTVHHTNYNCNTLVVHNEVMHRKMSEGVNILKPWLTTVIPWAAEISLFQYFLKIYNVTVLQSHLNSNMLCPSAIIDM